MATAARAVALKTEARAGEIARASIIVGNISAKTDSFSIADPQPGRIIALHWLRSEKGEPSDD